MEDEKGLYYYPNPANRKERMYVRVTDGVIQFRLWNQDVAELWEKHGWLDYDLVKEGSKHTRFLALDFKSAELIKLFYMY